MTIKPINDKADFLKASLRCDELAKLKGMKPGEESKLPVEDEIELDILQALIRDWNIRTKDMSPGPYGTKEIPDFAGFGKVYSVQLSADISALLGADGTARVGPNDVGFFHSREEAETAKESVGLPGTDVVEWTTATIQGSSFLLHRDSPIKVITDYDASNPIVRAIISNARNKLSALELHLLIKDTKQ